MNNLTAVLSLVGTVMVMPFLIGMLSLFGTACGIIALLYILTVTVRYLIGAYKAKSQGEKA